MSDLSKFFFIGLLSFFVPIYQFSFKKSKREVNYMRARKDEEIPAQVILASYPKDNITMHGA